MKRSLEALGLGSARRAAILHVDDVGMCHGANAAFLQLFRAGLVTTGSVMVPCPWFAEIAAEARRDRALDLGVHLTLTSEWETYRWRAISTTSPSSGLLDDDGYLPRNCLRLRDRLVPEAAEIELRAQIDRALGAGIDATHLDTHMGAALVPELLAIYLRLGVDYRLPVLLPRELGSYFNVLNMGAIDAEPYARAVAALEAAGAPLADHFRMTPGAATADAERTYRQLVTTLPDGVTFVSLHTNTPGDIETIVPPRAHWRTDEYHLFASGQVRDWLTREGIATLGLSAVRNLHRARVASMGGRAP